MNITTSDLVGKPTNFKNASWEGANIHDVQNVSGAILPGKEHLAIKTQNSKISLMEKLFSLIPGMTSKSQSKQKAESEIKPEAETPNMANDYKQTNFVQKLQNESSVGVKSWQAGK